MPVGRPKKDQVRLTFGNTAECSACRLRSGLIFLAFHKQAAIKPILKNELARMEEPKPSTPELTAIADTVRREGFAWIDGQVFHGYRAIAAPIFDMQGALRAAMSLVSNQAARRHFKRGLVGADR